MTRTPCHLPRRRRGSWDGAGPWKPEGGSPRPRTPSSLPSSFSAAAGPAPLPRVREKRSPFPAAGAPASLPPARCGAQWVPFATVPERRPAASRPHSSQARTAARTCLPVLADPPARSGGEGAAPAPGLGPLPPSSSQLPPAARAARSWQGPASQTPARCPPGPGTRSSPRAPGLGGESGAAPTPSPRPAAPVQHRDGGQRPDGGAAEPGSREEGES